MFVVSMIAQVESFGGSCGGLQQEMFSAENRVLKNFVYKRKTVANHVICGRDCSMDKHCKSFNFYINTKLCELNNATWAEHQEDFIEQQGSVYFHEYEDTANVKPLCSLAYNSLAQATTYKSCQMLLNDGYSLSGVYTIYPDGFRDGLHVYCDMDTDDGGWIVFQSRLDGSVDFHRNWTEYKFGFGGLCSEFWLGNDNLVKLTSSTAKWMLRVELENWDGNKMYAKYSDFFISGDKYTLNIGLHDYSSTAQNYLEHHNGKQFTTKDQDNDDYQDTNCADLKKGGWWFTACGHVFLNGEYGQSVGDKGIVWFNEPLKKCSMMIRERNE